MHSVMLPPPLQEAATSIGYGAAALPLWEEFVLRFFKHETQLGPIVPKDAISGHLAKLAQLYEGSSPVLSNIYALLAPLSPESLPGELLWGNPLLCWSSSPAACDPHLELWYHPSGVGMGST